MIRYVPREPDDGLGLVLVVVALVLIVCTAFALDCTGWGQP